MKTIKKIILTVLLITTVTVCFAKPKDKAETEKIVKQFFQNGSCIIRYTENWGAEYTRIINKDTIVEIQVSDNGISIYQFNYKDAITIKFDKVDVSLDENSNLVIKKL